MPEISVSEADRDRLAAVQDDLEAAYVGEYGSVRPADAIAYLLDTYRPPDDLPDDRAASTESTASSTDGGRVEAQSSPAATLQQAQSLLDDNGDKWRESDGDAPYEVDLPDGGTEPARTKDDVKRLLFRHYR